MALGLLEQPHTQLTMLYLECVSFLVLSPDSELHESHVCFSFTPISEIIMLADSWEGPLGFNIG